MIRTFYLKCFPFFLLTLTLGGSTFLTVLGEITGTVPTPVSSLTALTTVDSVHGVVLGTTLSVAFPFLLCGVSTFITVLTLSSMAGTGSMLTSTSFLTSSSGTGVSVWTVELSSTARSVPAF